LGLGIEVRLLVVISGLESWVQGAGFGFWGLGFGVQGGVWGLGFGGWGLGFGVWGLEVRFQDLGFRV